MSLLTKNQLFYIALIITVIVLLLFVFYNYKYTNFLLTNVNMMYIASLILGLFLTYMVYKPVVASDTKTDDVTVEEALRYQPQRSGYETDKELINKYSNIYQLVFEILTLDAIIANNRTTALNSALQVTKTSDKTIATIENIRNSMSTFTLKYYGLEDDASKQVKQKLDVLSTLIDSIKVSLDTNIIVALQLIYDLDTQNSRFSTEILLHAKDKAIQRLSTLPSIKPDDDDKYFVKDIYTQDYSLLISKIKELDVALSSFLGNQRQHEYELIADGIGVSRYMFGVSGSGAGKKNFKDLVELVFDTDDEKGGIYRFMNKLFDIIDTIKSA